MRQNDLAATAFDRTESLISDAAGSVNDTIDMAADVVADSTSRFNKHVRSAASRATSAISDKTQQLRDLDPRALVDEAASLTKRYPGVTLLAVATLGFFAGRALSRNRS